MEAIRFKPQSESRFVSNPIAPGVGQINSGILTLSGSIHSRNLTITSIHKVGQTIPGIPGSDDSRNKWVRLFPEYMGEVIPGIGGSEVSGIFTHTKRESPTYHQSTGERHAAKFNRRICGQQCFL